MNKLKVFLLIFLINIGCIQSANAATLDDVVNAINGLKNYISDTFNATMDVMGKLLYKENPSAIPAENANRANNNATNVANTNANTASSSTIETTLTANNNVELQRLANIIASDTYLPPAQRSLFGERATMNPALGNQAFNAEALLGPVAYENYDFKNPKSNPQYNFIQFVSNSYQPLIPPTMAKDFNSLSEQKKLELQTNSDFQNYRAALRSFVATQSVGLSNLYQLMSERIPQPNLGKVAGLPNKKDASQLEVQEYLANRRVQNSDWYKQMAAEPPAVVSRETLLVLAEIRQQLFQMQLVNERILATLSVMQMQQNLSNKVINNSAQLEGAAKAQIDAAAGKKPEGIEGLPNTQTQGQ